MTNLQLFHADARNASLHLRDDFVDIPRHEHFQEEEKSRRARSITASILLAGDEWKKARRASGALLRFPKKLTMIAKKQNPTAAQPAAYWSYPAPRTVDFSPQIPQSPCAD